MLKLDSPPKNGMEYSVAEGRYSHKQQRYISSTSSFDQLLITEYSFRNDGKEDDCFALGSAYQLSNLNMSGHLARHLRKYSPPTNYED